MILLSSPCSAATDIHFSTTLLLASLRAGQKRSKCSSEPTSWPVQPGMEQIPALLFVQCRESLSVTYLPDNILAWITALWISYGFVPHVNQIGWGAVKDINSGLKYLREFSLKLVASVRKWVSQWSTTLDFTSFLYASLVGGSWSSEMGDARLYMRQRSLICRNQDPEDGFAKINWYTAIL